LNRGQGFILAHLSGWRGQDKCFQPDWRHRQSSAIPDRK